VVSEAELLDGLVRFAERAGTAVRPTEPVDSWVLVGDAQAEELVQLLERDPQVAAVIAAGDVLRTAAGTGLGYDTRVWLLGFLRETRDPATDTAAEARRLLRFLRIEGGVVPMRARVTLFGLSVQEPAVLPFGRLMPATGRDRALSDPPDVLPPSVVFECVVEAAARITPTDELGWSIEDSEQHEADLYTRLDQEGLGRLLLALALCFPGPVQEHLVAFAPLYYESGVARDPVPLGPVWASSRMRRYEPDFRVDECVQCAQLVARVPVPGRLVAAARRYFQAGAERPRPADAIVDYATAIEAVTGTSDGKEQGAELVRLLGSQSFWAHRIAGDFKRLKDARNSILHDGVTPPDARSIRGPSQTLVAHAIHAAVYDRLS